MSLALRLPALKATPDRCTKKRLPTNRVIECGYAVAVQLREEATSALHGVEEARALSKASVVTADVVGYSMLGVQPKRSSSWMGPSQLGISALQPLAAKAMAQSATLTLHPSSLFGMDCLPCSGSSDRELVGELSLVPTWLWRIDATLE
eukprot:CAMPEP_0170604194 /NCGR_PEP_ID=MMETSP0224-20130122/19295_1 /TAXON_ID=285029 /ORGANISM="Togula jolla, Strain CCCM 725" /LENGTH=148 /DNA_ID=CAMNT_0010929085 /DNA_START=282 /DNA_END=726 /DNA_ORIENTATION=+